MNFILLFGLSLTYIFLRLRLKRIPNPIYFLSAVTLLYVVMSYGAFLPKAWTIYFEPSAILQQASFSLLVPTSFYIFREYFSSYMATRAGRLFVASEFIFLYVLTILVTIIGTEDLSGPMVRALYAMPSLGNFAMLLVISVTILLTCIGGLGRLIIVIAFCAMNLMSEFGQNYIFAIFFVAAAMFRSRAFVGLLISISVCLLAYLWMWLEPAYAISFDANLAVRLFFLQDAFDGFLETALVGVGFGTEGIRNYYSLFGFGEFVNPYAEQTNFINLAAHNSFATVAFRMGIVGFLALIWLMYEALRRCRVKNWKAEEARRCITFFAAFLVMFLNPALESPFYYYGVSLCLAAIWAGDDADPISSRVFAPERHDSNLPLDDAQTNLS